MLNQTIFQTISYEQITSVVQTPIMYVVLGIIWFLPIALIIFIGFLTHARSLNGEKLKRRAISSPNYWISIVILLFFQSALIVGLLIFPFWTNFF